MVAHNYTCCDQKRDRREVGERARGEGGGGRDVGGRGGGTLI